jgi:hypothetical protein
MYDLYGRLVEQRNASNNSLVKIGDAYRPGAYLIRAMQGQKSVELKLIKIK